VTVQHVPAQKREDAHHPKSLKETQGPGHPDATVPVTRLQLSSVGCTRSYIRLTFAFT